MSNSTGNKKNPLINNPVVKAVGTQRAIAILALIVLFGFFSIASPAFRQYSTFVSILDASYYIGFMAIGVTFAIITGGIDLSIGTVLSTVRRMGKCLSRKCPVHCPWPVIPSRCCCLSGLAVALP